MPELTRRAAVGAGVGVVTIAAISAVGTPALATALTRTPLALPFIAAAAAADGLPVRSHFLGHEGERFIASSDGTRTAFVLRSVEDIPSAPAGDENHYSLLFSTDAAGDGIYELTHPSVPAATLFLAAVGGSGTVQAVVNRA